MKLESKKINFIATKIYVLNDVDIDNIFTLYEYKVKWFMIIVPKTSTYIKSYNDGAK